MSIFVFAILGLYLENILPAAAGVRKPFYFPFTKSFWFDSPEAEKYENSDNENNLEKCLVNNSDEENKALRRSNFEEINDFLKRKQGSEQCLTIDNLKKRFDHEFWAVRGLDTEMYQDQIFALLGHNGAGKTTTMNML